MQITVKVFDEVYILSAQVSKSFTLVYWLILMVRKLYKYLTYRIQMLH